jgi:hypothetical protein
MRSSTTASGSWPVAIPWVSASSPGNGHDWGRAGTHGSVGDCLSMTNRHVASDVLHDLITSILVAITAVIASGLLDRVWDAL